MRIASLPSVCLVACVSVVFSVSVASRAGAQTADAIGVRAQGMGGAFTAVADDATASWWNPAGLAGGAYLNALIEIGSHRDPPDNGAIPGDAASAWRANVRSFAFGFPALGVSYYRLQFSEIQPETSTGAATGDRQEGGAAQVRLRSMILNQFGTTVGQSLGSHLVVGTTAKLVNAGVASAAAPTGSLDTAALLPVSGETHFDLDLGVMAVFGRARLGLTVRNLWAPEFYSGADAFTLTRQARAGVALSSGTRGVIGAATVAFDADLTTTPTVLGDERRVAVGTELWMPSKAFGFRGGVGASTIGERRTSLSAGGSAALKKGFYVDGELTGGTDHGRRGWSVSLRLTYP
jgi:hypothetical protein